MKRTIIPVLIAISSCTTTPSEAPPSDASGPAALLSQGGNRIANGAGVLGTQESEDGSATMTRRWPHGNSPHREAALTVTTTDPCANIATAGAPGITEQGECVFGPLGVDGDVTAHGDVQVDGVASVGGVAAHGDIVLDAGVNLVLQGSGRVVAPPKTITMSVDAAAFRPITTATSVDYTNGLSFSGGTGVIAALPIPDGSQVVAVRFYVSDSQATIIQGGIIERYQDGSTTGDLTAGSLGTGAPQVLSPVLHRPHVIVSGAGHFLRLLYFSGSSPATISFAAVDFQPA